MYLITNNFIHSKKGSKTRFVLRSVAFRSKKKKKKKKRNHVASEWVAELDIPLHFRKKQIEQNKFNSCAFD